MDKNPDNVCANLFEKFPSDKLDKLDTIVKHQLGLQSRFSDEWKWMSTILTPGRIPKEEMVVRCNTIIDNWNNVSVEYGEMMNRLPYKYWKHYADKEGFISFTEEEVLEIFFEYIDMLHFFINIGLALGLTAEMIFNLYMSKNKENHNRQDNNY